MTGDYKNAKINLEKAAARLWDPVLYRNLGDTYVKLNRFEKAEKMYKTAIMIDPRKMYPRYVLAVFYKNQGDTIRAREIAETLVRMPDRIPTNASKQIRSEMQTLLK